MFYRYRNYSHASGEVALTVRQQAKDDERGFRKSIIVEHELEGHIQAANSTALTTAIRSLTNGYALDGGNAGLYDDNGVVTAHFMDSRLTVGGVRVKSIEFPFHQPHMATHAKYRIVLEAEFPQTQIELLAFEETITQEGTGGPETVIIRTRYGRPIKQQVSQFTPITIVQSGSAVGFEKYPEPPLPLWPNDEIVSARIVGEKGPVNMGGAFRDFGITWSYTFEFTTPPVLRHPHAR